MTDRIPIELEARLVGLSKQRRKDGDWVEVKFHIHPDDHPAALFILPLGTDCTLSIKGVPESAEEAPETQTAPEATRVKGGARSKRAGIACGQATFQEHIFAEARKRGYVWSIELSREDAAAAIVRTVCGCKESRAELDHNENAGQIWDSIERDYRAAMAGQTDETLKEQARL